NGGGRRGSPGRGGSAVAADFSLHRLVTAIPPSLVVTGQEDPQEEMSKEEDLSFSFIDVPPDAPYTHALYELVKRGIVSGYEDEKGNPLQYFYPDRPVTIAEFSKMLCKALGLPWDDVLPRTLSAQNDHWAYGYIAKLELLGLRVFHNSLINIDSDLTQPMLNSMFEDLGLPLPLTTEPFDRQKAIQTIFNLL
ncbi:MAG: S-layer homology domain-containing protein, partial [Nanoarchaeota archaeon]|nr:S-layer homology domain-containing protein [Nanoarchaeota archaeon]